MSRAKKNADLKKIVFFIPEKKSPEQVWKKMWKFNQNIYITLPFKLIIQGGKRKQ